ncbi:MAG: Na+/H+ antiporter [Candidatus Eremiobacteraeota bacterium]|nr:Na+/H+ antiporter [Candidatus Eremiobacteraeota bacterium]
MYASSLLLLLLAAIVIVAAAAKRFSLPYPIAFVLGGSLLAFVPNLPAVTLDPNWIFLLFLPPLLYSGGWATDWEAFKGNARSIGLLAVGLVVFTTAFVGVVVHALAPGLGWAAAFVLGAIVSPPDAVAASSVFERFSVSQRVKAILDGEGLVNDATALVIYRFAVAAVVTGTFSASSAGLAFVGVSVGGVVLGLAFGYLLVEGTLLLRRFELSDYQIDNAIQLLAPYAIYLTGELTHVSGVLATVTAGIFVSRQAGRIYEPEGRLVAYAVWDLLIFLLNGLVFLLIGLQLRSIVASPTFAIRELWIGLIVSALVIVLRIAWVFPGTYLPRFLSKGIREREKAPPANAVFVVAWSGMRGIVSLAGALALPRLTASGAPFPGRDEILFITFCVIFVTLVFQGLSLIPLLDWLHITGDDIAGHEIEVRVKALRAGIARLRELEAGFASTEEWEVEGRLLGEYEYRIAHLSGHLDGTIDAQAVAFDHRLQEEALRAERHEITQLRDSGEIPDEIYRRIQYDLDLADERIN